MINRKIEYSSAWLLLIPLGLFLFFACSCITKIGINYDEAIFVNGALGGINNELIFKRFFGIPFMLLPDQGAIKSYLYYPIFKMVGVSALSIRLPAILLSTLTLFFWFKITNKIVRNNYLALMCVALMATDPAFILHSKVDTSPVVLQNLLMAITLYCYQCSFEKKALLNMALVFIAMILGLLNKINFLWFVLAFGYVAFLYDSKHVFSIYKQNRVIFSGLFIGFIAVLIFIIIYLIIPPALHFPIGGMTTVKLSQKIGIVFNLYLQTFNGAWRYQSIFYQPLVVPSIVNLVELTTMVLWLISLAMVRVFKINNDNYQRYQRSILFFLMLFVIEFMFMLFTPHTYTPGHVMVLWPLPHLLFVLMALAILSLFPKKLLILPVTVLAVIFSQCYVNHEYNVAFDHPKADQNLIWSPAIYKLSDYVNKQTNYFDNIISVDAGTQTQLFALAKNNKDRLKFHEFWFLFSSSDFIKQCAVFMYPFFNKEDAVNQQWLYDHYYKGKRNLVIMYSHEELRYRVKETFYSFIAQHHVRLTPMTTIAGVEGVPTYDLFVATG